MHGGESLFSLGSLGQLDLTHKPTRSSARSEVLRTARDEGFSAGPWGGVLRHSTPSPMVPGPVVWAIPSSSVPHSFFQRPIGPHATQPTYLNTAPEDLYPDTGWGSYAVQAGASILSSGSLGDWDL